MTITRDVLLCCVCALFLVTPAFSQEQASVKADIRVKKIFEQAKLKHSVNNYGDVSFVNGISGRTQMVTINSKTSNLGSLELREIWSIGFKSTGKVSSEVSHRLLLENAKAQLGAWSIGKMGDKEVAIFRANIPADANEKTLLIHVQAISETADALEKELVKSDDL